MVKNVLLKKIFYGFLNKEKYYLLSAFLILGAIYFILYVLLLSKDIYLHYTNGSLVLLPKKIVVVPTEKLQSVTKAMKNHNISKKDFIVCGVKNYDNIALHKLKYTQDIKLIPSAYTFLMLNIDFPILNGKCKNKKYTLAVKDISFHRRRRWYIKTEPINIVAKYFYVFIKKNQYLKLKIIKNNYKYTLLSYTPNIQEDKLFYPFLISLINDNFLNFYPSSQYLSYKNRSITTTENTKMYAKMLENMFGVIFSNKRRIRVLSNIEAYKYLTNYDGIYLRFLLKDNQNLYKMFVLDKIPFAIPNIADIKSKIFIGNMKSFKNISYDKYILFIKKDINLSFLKGYKTFTQKEIIPKLYSLNSEVHLIIIAIVGVLLILLISIVISFLSRLYNLYELILKTFLFYGYSIKVLFLMLSTTLILSMLFALVNVEILLSCLNDIFYQYYLNQIKLEIDYNSILIILIVVLVVAYIYESYLQQKVLEKYKG